MVQKCIANIWRPCQGFNQIVVGEIEEEGYVIRPCAIKLMEDEKGKSWSKQVRFGIMSNPCTLYNLTLWIYRIVGSI